VLLQAQRRRKSKSRFVDVIQVLSVYPNTIQDQHVLESSQLFFNPSKSRDDILCKGVVFVTPENSITIKY
jgi:hypothetical protein